MTSTVVRRGFRHTHSIRFSVPAMFWSDSILCTPTGIDEATILAFLASQYPGMSSWGVVGTDWTYEVIAFAR